MKSRRRVSRVARAPRWVLGGRPSSLACTLTLAALAGACGGGSGGGGGPIVTAPTGLGYATSRVLLEIDEELPPLVPTVSGTVTSWSVEPPLPAGLVLDAGDGSIGGTPTQLAERTLHTVRAANSAGASETTLELHVLGLPRFLLVANENDSTLSRLALDQPGRLAHAGFHTLSNLQFGPQTVQLHPSGLFLYTANADTDTLSAFVVDPVSGAVSSGSNVAAGSAPHHIALHPGGALLYLGEAGGNRVRTFSIDPTTGTLSFVQSLEGLSPGLSQLLVDPQGRFLIALHASQSLMRALPLDPATGLPSLGVAVPLAGAAPLHASFGTSGDRLYVALSLDPAVNVIAAYPVTSPQGALGTPQTRAVGDVPAWTAVHPEGTFLYVLRPNQEDVRRFRIDPSGGELTLDADEGAAPAGSRLFLDERGRRAYLLDSAGQELIALGLDPSSGALSETHRVRNRPGARALVLLRGSAPLARLPRQIYVAQSGDGSVRTLDVQADGELSWTAVDVPAGAAPRDVAVDPRQRFAFVLNSSEVRSFAIQSDGTLEDTGHFVPAGTQPTAITVDPSGRFLFLIDELDDQLTLYSIGEDGSLDERDDVSTAPRPRSLGVDPTGCFLVVANDGLAPNGAESVLRSYPIDPHLATLGAASVNAPAPGSATSLTFSLEGHLVYSTLTLSNLMVPYQLDAVSGELTPVPTGTPAAIQPRDVVLTPDGRFGYIAVRNPGNPGRINVHDVRESDGSLWNEQVGNFNFIQSVETGSQALPSRLAMSPHGTHLYVMNEGTDSVSVFEIGSDGFLTAASPISTAALPLDMALRSALE